MAAVVVTPPEALPVSLEEAKTQLRVDSGDDDSYIQSLVVAATTTLDGPAGWLGRALVTQTLELRSDGFGCEEICLPYPPILAVESIVYDDLSGVAQTVSPDVYRLVGGPDAPRLALAYGKTWPQTRSQSEAVRVRYSAGWPVIENVWTGPEAIKHCIRVLVAELYANREASAEPGRVELPFAVTALLSTYRVYR
jgi:uncharacterized phiE125 gp8 family phage protein